MGVCGCSELPDDPPAPAPLRPLLAGEAGGELVVELVADVLEELLLALLPFLPSDSSSVWITSCPLEEPLFLEAGAGGVAWVQRFFAGGGVSSSSLSLLFRLPSIALSEPFLSLFHKPPTRGEQKARLRQRSLQGGILLKDI